MLAEGGILQLAKECKFINVGISIFDAVRLREIDFLRGIAVILVLFRHNDYVAIINKIGWAGVDLFFVLSGFLVSGLLFQEYKTHETISPKRFLIRRGFKIYPLFYLFLFFTLFIEQIFFYGVDKRALLHDILFLQSYLPGIWGHAWSLAVEEHFYFGLLFFVFLAVKTGKIEKSMSIILFFLGVASSCLLFRLYNAYTLPFTTGTHYAPTHLRIDSLFFGVVLSYYYHFRKEQFIFLFQKYRKSLYGLSVLLLVLLFIFPIEHPFMHSLGLTFTYLGFGLILSLFISDTCINNKLNRLFSRHLVSIISAIGYYSYAIYLFHFPIRKYVTLLELSPGANFLVYFLISLATGIIISKTIEQKILQIRDKIFPKRKLVPHFTETNNTTIIQTAGISVPL